MRAYKHQAIMHKKRKEKNDTWHDDTEKTDAKITHSLPTSNEDIARTRNETLSLKDFPIKGNTSEENSQSHLTNLHINSSSSSSPSPTSTTTPHLTDILKMPRNPKKNKTQRKMEQEDISDPGSSSDYSDHQLEIDLKTSTHEEITLQINHLKDLFNKLKNTTTCPATHITTTNSDNPAQVPHPQTDATQDKHTETPSEDNPPIDWNHSIMTIFDTAITKGEDRTSKALQDKQTLSTTDWTSFLQQNSAQETNTMDDLWSKETTAIYADQTQIKVVYTGGPITYMTSCEQATSTTSTYLFTHMYLTTQ